MPIEPLAHLGMLVGGIIIGDGMDQLTCWHRRLDGVEETNELLMPVPRQNAPITLPSSTSSRQTAWWCHAACNRWTA